MNKTRTKDPRESAIFSLASSKSSSSTMRARAEGEAPVLSPVQELVSPPIPHSPIRSALASDNDSAETIKFVPLIERPVIDLAQGIPQMFTFDSNHTDVRFHTYRTHIEFSRLQADSLAYQPTPSDSVMNLSVAWLGPSEAARVAGMEREAVADLGDDWTTMTPKEGVLWSDSGLLIRNGEDLVQIKTQIT
jgi:hypothetical protein